MTASRPALARTASSLGGASSVRRTPRGRPRHAALPSGACLAITSGKPGGSSMAGALAIATGGGRCGPALKTMSRLGVATSSSPDGDHAIGAGRERRICRSTVSCAPLRSSTSNRACWVGCHEKVPSGASQS
eukprot:scaffold27823_cov129-Isochrysis_galbana.AAC.5